LILATGNRHKLAEMVELLPALALAPLPAGFESVKRVVEASFAHRRKTLPNSLALAGLASRQQGVEALAEIGQGANVRAEELEPAEFVALAAAL